MTLFNNKYRAESLRLPYWDYSSDGYYFVTICAKNMECVLGEIRNEIIGLNEIGCIAAKSWTEIPDHFPFVVLDEWIVMPNHVHGIIHINRPAAPSVETIHELSLHDQKYRRKMIIPKIIGRFKMQTAKEINILRKTQGQSVWQKDYFDHIIRDEKSLDNIREYIRFNPLKWESDRNNPEGLWT